MECERTMKKMLRLFLILPLLACGAATHDGQFQIGDPTYSCTPPATTYRWAAYNSANTCSGGSTCTNGLGIDTLVDFISANNATQTVSGNRMTYTTGGVNGLPVATGGSGKYFNVTIPLPTAVTYYAVVTGNGVLMSRNTGFTATLEWLFGNSQNTVNAAGAVFIGSGSPLPAATGYVGGVFQYNFSTHAWAFYNCASGTCTAAGSGTTAGIIYQPDAFGYDQGDGYFNGSIAEIGYFNSTTTAGIGPWMACKYGI